MLSSDKNVETIAQLVEALKSYMGLQKEYLKLNVIEKVVRLLTALTVAIVFIILGVAVLFCSGLLDGTSRRTGYGVFHHRPVVPLPPRAGLRFPQVVDRASFGKVPSLHTFKLIL